MTSRHLKGRFQDIYYYYFFFFWLTLSELFFMSWPIAPVGNLKSIGSAFKLPPMVTILGSISHGPPKRIFGVST
ncbi:hypothetical protein E2C01_051178 [Portunus trituberculatus]|uniref:Uncharacterized protein n=1 Tax=Portunus trituberculatus TaxID=210409 RepID=A0A5B7GID4_PORTR|nr:hypothetical protein [Portunus trituberculatus]